MRHPESALTQLECSECGQVFNADSVHTFCAACHGPLLARYDFQVARATLTPAALQARPRGLWRWGEILPVRAASFRISLGEANTPALKAARLGDSLGLDGLFIKDESGSPAGSFNARGMALAVARALELGRREFVIATTGSAGGALAAYAARAHCRAHVYMPKDAPVPNQVAVRTFGAELVLVDGSLLEAARLAGQAAGQHGWLNVSAFEEPYACEGKKTLGLELAEAFDWDLPDVIVYPAGSGAGLVAAWKAFAELEQLGFLDARRPRLVCVQAQGCAPIVQAFNQKSERADVWAAPPTGISGLKVPAVFADRLVLRTIQFSNGIALAISDEDILVCQKEMATREGIFAAPEGAAALAAVKQLLASGWLDRAGRVVLVNTGSGLAC